MAGRASIVGAAATHVGRVREHNEDSHYFDADLGLFLVCDGMGGHAAGEVASALAIRTIRAKWASDDTMHLINAWLDTGDPDARKQLIETIRSGGKAAHAAILADAATDDTKSGMGTTLVGALVVGNEAVFAHAGDSRAYLVRDAIAMQLTEDHTLLARLLAAGIDVDVSGEGSRFRSMLTNALGIGVECKVATFVVPLADGDRFLLCSDGVSEYVKEAEIGEVLTKQPSPARAANRLVELALERGGGDNATAIVVRVLEAGESPQPIEQRRRDDAVIEGCPIWSEKTTPQQRLRALRIAIPRELDAGERLPAHTMGDRVAWIVIAGTLVQDGALIEPGALVYPESLVTDAPPPGRDALAIAQTELRLLALRADDFRELCDEDTDLGESLLGTIGPLIATRRLRLTGRNETVVDRLGEIQARFADLETQPKARLEPVPDLEPDLDEVITSRLEAMSVAPSIERAVERAVERAGGVQPGSLVASPLSRPVVPPLKLPPISRTLPALPSRPSDPKTITIPAPKLAPFVSKPAPAPKKRPPTEPEIEAYIELDAEPASAEELDPSPDHDTMTLSVDDGGARVTETVTDNSSQTLMLTVTEATPPRTITPEVAVQVSGLIDDDPFVTITAELPPDVDEDAVVTITAGAPPETRPRRDDEDDAPEVEIVREASEPVRRPKRVSEGWDD